ncbi:MAG: PEGA domain-containing protein [Candidatus Microsaccharimonas sp.]
MYRRPSKKQLLLQRIIVSVISVLAVLVIVTGTILFILGFRLDSEKGRLEQGALLQFESVPAGADIAIDSKPTGVRTAGKQSVLAGAHSFVVSKNGYESWAKSLTVKAGTLTWLDYIRLVPKDLKPETVATYSTIVGEKASPDLKTLIIQEKTDTPTFQLVDLRSQDIKSTAIALPAAAYSEATTAGVTHSFMLDHWDLGGRYMLLKHAYNDTSEWIVFDTQNPDASVNISRLLSISVSQLEFAGTNGSLLYGLLSDGTVRKLDVSAATISRPLISNVKTFDLSETNRISYVGIDPNNAAQQVAGVYRDGDAAPHVLRTVSSLETPLFIDMVIYRNDDYVVIAEGLKVTVLKGTYPTSSNDDVSSLKVQHELTVNGAVSQLSFSEDGDYLVVQSGLSFVGYELEHERATTGSITAIADQPVPQLHWLDNAYLWTDYGGTLVIREFDGTNSHTINSVAQGLDVTLSQNGRYLYSMVKSGDSYYLQRVKMILD